MSKNNSTPFNYPLATLYSIQVVKLSTSRKFEGLPRYRGVNSHDSETSFPWRHNTDPNTKLLTSLISQNTACICAFSCIQGGAWSSLSLPRASQSNFRRRTPINSMGLSASYIFSDLSSTSAIFNTSTLIFHPSSYLYGIQIYRVK